MGLLTKLYMHAGLPQSNLKWMSLSQLAKMVQSQAAIDAMAYAIYATGAIVVFTIILTLCMSSENKNPKDKEGEKSGIKGGISVAE